jgi:Dolichyl-phosphate-mannose-protein mannosyltransferase
MGAALLFSLPRKSLTNDEFYNIPAGLYNLSAHDFGINNVHPPPVRMIAAAPLLPLHLNLPPRQPSANAISGGHETFTAFWFANLARLDQIAFWSRVPMVTLTLLLGVVIFIFARGMFGARAAVLAVFLFSLEPTILAHGRIVQTDVPAALAYLFFCLMLFRFAKESTMRNALIVGLACGLALVTKSSLLVTVPMFAAIASLAVWRAPQRSQVRSRLLLSIGLALVALILAINASYFFQRAPLESNDVRWLAAEFPSRFNLIMAAIRGLSAILPPYFLFVFAVVSGINHEGWPASLLGMYSQTGWWYYFPVAFALKTTIPFLLISVSALGWSIYGVLAEKRIEFFWLLLPLALYAALTMSSNINIGIRHFLPVFPFLFILSGAFLDRLLKVSYRKSAIALVVLSLCLMSFEAVRTYPDYLSYMNQLAWSHPHWYYLSDSNVEWGDDASGLAQYLHARGETRVRAAVLGGWITLARYGIEYVDAATQNPNSSRPRYTAIGASFLNGSTVPRDLKNPDGSQLTEEQRHDFFAAYRQRTPEAIFGNSIYLYRERD